MEEETPEVKHPNREKPEAIRTKRIVTMLLVVSAILLTILLWGGWSRFEGMKGAVVFFIAVYLLFAFFVARWNRGVLPVASALAIFLIIFAAVAAPAWFARDANGFSDSALPAALMGWLTILVIPLQIVLIGFAMKGFQQGWNVEAGTRAYFDQAAAQNESA